jgi:biopolymer transport protein TolR
VSVLGLREGNRSVIRHLIFINRSSSPQMGVIHRAQLVGDPDGGDAMTRVPTNRAALLVQPNVTPMLDVMLVLLIIFMVITPALLSYFEPAPPRAINLARYPEHPGDHTLWIDRGGGFYLNKRWVRAVDLEPALRQLMRSLPNDGVLYLLADRSLDYGIVHHAMATAARSGVRVVGLIAEERWSAP